jgi:DNA polymerase III alpha subunit (gram-positive type)
MSYVLYVIDTETTGLDENKHDIIEICLWRIGDAESKTWCLTPFNPANIENEALAINHHKREDILHKTAAGREKYRDPKSVLSEIEMYLMEDCAAAEDRVIVGQNPNFDYKFMLKLWEKCGDIEAFPFGYWIDNKNGTKRNQSMLFDTIDMVKMIDFCTGRQRKRYNLGSLVKDFHVTKAQAHVAYGDVKMTKDLFETVFNRIKDVVKDRFDDCYAPEQLEE